MVSTGRKVALGGILGALCILFLYLAVYLPTSRLFLYCVSSLFCSVMMVESGQKWAWTFYGATSILAFIIIPDKVGIAPYLAFFGYYGIIKYYIEGTKSRVLQLALKGGFFLIALILGFILVQELFMVEILSIVPLWAAAIGAVAIFYIYDYVYTQFITYYEKRLRRMIGR